MYRGYTESPIGLIEVTATEIELVSVLFVDEKQQSHENEIIHHFLYEIDAYFKGDLKQFTIPPMNGTAFQSGVWNELIRIPYGDRLSYSEIAHRIQKQKAVRAVGTAIGKNKYALIVPCHRVFSKNGSLSGFAWGSWRKEWLLEHEKNHSQK
ncbi:methylated-DNA--[protein]-cysteine S-methyltransferase [Paenisporosarcina sp. NPDC076898]|uniref:methylated-DNA--[protein]-cysteine S-methyltransferase n=1 Tax=unclassified Paenisporosarcina TaxID=2642018 RepID=UPI003D069B78